MLESYPPEQWVQMSLKRVEELCGTKTLERGQESAAVQEQKESAACSGNAVADKDLKVDKN